MKLTITRHGETEENANGIFQGHLPGKLTKKGKEQARKLSERLKDEKFDVIFSSDLARASDTAKEIIKFHSDVPIYFIKGLRERFMGDAQGKTKEELGWEGKEKRGEIMEKCNAESIPNFTKRAETFNRKLLENFLGKNVLLVGHAGINTAIIANIIDEDWLSFFNKSKKGNTSVSIIEFDKNKKPKITLIGCTKHLEELENLK